MAEDIFSSLSPLSAAYFFILRKQHFSDIVAVGRNQRERAWETASAPARSKSAAAELYCFIRLRTSGRAFSAASTCLSGRMRCIACIQTSPISGRKALPGLLCLIGKHQASQRHFFHVLPDPRDSLPAYGVLTIMDEHSLFRLSSFIAIYTPCLKKNTADDRPLQ